MRHIVLWLSVALATSGCCCALGGELSEEDRARLAQERAEERAAEAAAIAHAPARAASVASLGPRLSAGPAPERCPEERLEAQLGASMLRHAVPTASALALAGGESSEWRWQASSEVDEWRRIRGGEASLSDDLLARAGGAETSVVVVFIHEERAAPRVTRDDGLLRAGSYEGGFWEGELRVVDVDRGEVLCGAHFVAESSETIDGDDDFEEALQDDFRERFEDAANAALGRITDLLSVRL